ncbi:MAG: membrane protein insertase YidC [Alphaproteobacteria bacterium GWF2_58_20]|nr:MAG: membrane protein insertase YidC [Alphaproteobacteria bacterium GWF2_58_20]
MSEQKNLFIAFALSVGVLFAFNQLYERPRMEKLRQQQAVENAKVQQTAAATAPGTPDTLPSDMVSSARMTTAVLPRIRIETPSLTGSMTITGNQLDDLLLVRYAENIDKPERVRLLATRDSDRPYHVDFGFMAEGSSQPMPDAQTPWTADRTVLTPDNPVTLRWDNGQGLVFTRHISVDQDYMFTMTQDVHNTSDADVSLSSFALIQRRLPKDGQNTAILHEGPIGVLGGELETAKYKALTDRKTPMAFSSNGGWLGITDKYWLVALCPQQDTPLSARFLSSGDNAQVDAMGPRQKLAAGQTLSNTFHVFAGAKKVTLLDSYSQKLGIPHFDLAVDFGWYYFLTKPLFYALTWLGKLIGNFGLAILALTVLVRLAMYPVSGKSFKEMNKMKTVQPKVAELREKYGDDKARLQQELMELYKREKVNPFSGCLPMLLQIPVFFSLYKVLFVSLEMRHTPFFGWIHDLAAPDPTTIFNLFGLIPWNPPAMLMLGAWPLLMGVTMLLQQKMNPAPVDPAQAKIMMIMPIMFTFMLAKFPAGLVIYWTWSNIISILQQGYMMRRKGLVPAFIKRWKDALHAGS